MNDNIFNISSMLISIFGILPIIFGIFFWIEKRRGLKIKIGYFLKNPFDLMDNKINREIPFFSIYYTMKKEFRPNVVPMVFKLENTSRNIIENISVRLTYPALALVENEDLARGDEEISRAIRIKNLNSESASEILLKSRKYQSDGKYVFVTIEIPNLRPGESYDISELVKISNFKENDDRFIDTMFSNIESYFKLISNIVGFCVVDIEVLSKDRNPILFRRTVCSIDVDNEIDFDSTLSQIRSALWGGDWPKPGTYFAIPRIVKFRLIRFLKVHISEIVRLIPQKIDQSNHYLDTRKAECSIMVHAGPGFDVFFAPKSVVNFETALIWWNKENLFVRQN